MDNNWSIAGLAGRYSIVGAVGGFYHLASYTCFGKRMHPLANVYIWLLPLKNDNVELYDVSNDFLWCCIVVTLVKGHVSVNVVWLVL